MIARTLGFVIATCVAAPVLAQADAYARHWPVQTDAPGVYAIELSPELYRQVQRADLGDLAAFNAAGEALAFGPLALATTAPEPQWRTAAWFSLPMAATANDDLLLQVNRAADGALSLRADVGASGATPAGGDLLVDTGVTADDHLGVQALAFDFAASAVDFSAELQIEASDDLSTWQLWVPRASVLRVRQGDQVLQRRTIDLPGHSARYLRLHRLDGAAPLSLGGVQISTHPYDAPNPRPTQTLVAEPAGRDGDAWLYRLPARVPFTQVNLRLAQDNAVARVSVSSREHGHDRWQARGSFSAFRLRADGVALDNEPLSLGGGRDREWRVTSDTPLASASVLEFAYRPERWLLLTQGAAPYLIAAGSSRAHRNTLPLAALLAPIRSKYGDDWQPPLITLGASVRAAGSAAIEPTVQERWSERALWLLLIGAALAIGTMVLRLLRERKAPP